jgi:hypothetical protein
MEVKLDRHSTFRACRQGELRFERRAVSRRETHDDVHDLRRSNPAGCLDVGGAGEAVETSKNDESNCDCAHGRYLLCRNIVEQRFFSADIIRERRATNIAQKNESLQRFSFARNNADIPAHLMPKLAASIRPTNNYAGGCEAHSHGRGECEPDDAPLRRGCREAAKNRGEHGFQGPFAPVESEQSDGGARQAHRACQPACVSIAIGRSIAIVFFGEPPAKRRPNTRDLQHAVRHV